MSLFCLVYGISVPAIACIAIYEHLYCRPADPTPEPRWKQVVHYLWGLVVSPVLLLSFVIREEWGMPIRDIVMWPTDKLLGR